MIPAPEFTPNTPAYRAFKRKAAEAMLDGALAQLRVRLGPAYSIEELGRSNSQLQTQVRIKPKDPEYHGGPRYLTLTVREPI